MTDAIHDLSEALAAISPGAYFVGGCVRDCLLRQPTKDVDLVTPADPWRVGQVVSRKLGGPLFWLREEDRVARLLLPTGGTTLQVDLSPLPHSIEEDLRLRDLTINAMAMRVEDGLRPDAPVLDPTGGQADLAAGVVRFAREDAAARDPLRTMRALRFRWKFGFTLAPETAALIRRYASHLRQTSLERIRDELFMMLALPSAHAAVADLVAHDLWRVIVPEAPEPPPWGEVPAPTESVRRLQAVIAAAAASVPELSALLDEELCAPRCRRDLLAWGAALLPLVQPPLAGVPPAGDATGEASAEHLRLSAGERKILGRALRSAPAAADFLSRWPVAGRERYHLFRAAEGAGAETVLLAALACGWSPAAEALLAEAVRRHLHPPPPLLTGDAVMRLLNIKRGPAIGRLLTAVEEARADRLIHTPEEAAEWLQQHARENAG